MRFVLRTLGFMALLATVAVGCSDSNDPDDDDNSRGTVQGSFGHSGNLGTITFVATTVLPYENSTQVGIIAVDAAGRRFTFSIDSKTTGTYTIAATGHEAEVEIGTQRWSSTGVNNGTITISTITATTMSGTVSLVLPTAPGSTGTGTMTVALTFSGTFGQT